MTTELLSLAPLSQDFETDWFKISPDKLRNLGKNAFATAIQLVWHDIAGFPDGIIEIFTSTVPGFGSKALVCSLSTIDNTSDTEYIALIFPFSYIKIKFIKNSISAGFLTVYISSIEK
jgi:hypothetical protein